MNKKYQIFISSTFTDLLEERQAVSRSILDLGHIPAGMEMFPAADEEQLSYIKKVIDECDYYLLIIGARYGSEDQDGISYTEQEYNYVQETGKTVLAFIHENTDDVPAGKSDKNDIKRQKLEVFVERVSTGRLVRFWNSPDDLKSKAIIALSKAFSNAPQIGWVRADTVANSDTMADVIKYRRENDQLRKDIKDIKNSINPKFSDASGLDTSIDIIYKYKMGYDRSYINGSVTVTFRILLQYLGDELFTPTTKSGVKTALGRRLINTQPQAH